MIDAISDWWSTLLWWVKALVVLAAVVVVALVVWLVWTLTHPQCGRDVSQLDGPCIGVTDGSVVLRPELADVLGRIERENSRVETSGQAWVSVAYLVPFGVPGTPSDLELPALRHELEGAYVGQLESNQSRSLGEPRPLVRLLVANDGVESALWPDVVSTLTAMSDPEQRFEEDRLVAVAASGQSVIGTQQALTALTANGVPVITSRLTGDQIIDSTTMGRPLARVAPTNSDQAAALASFLRPMTSRGLLVQDADPTDTYAQSLGEAFARSYPDAAHVLLQPVETYDPGATTSDMRAVLTNVCAQRPDVVFFAGRSSELLAFVEALPKRTCPDLPVRIVTGDDAVDFAAVVAEGSPSLRAGLRANATVTYAGVADAESWRTAPDAFAPGAPLFMGADCEQCFARLFPVESLEDGAAIMGHDAVATATWALRFNGVNDSPARMAQVFKRLHGPDAVPLASGWLSLSPGGDPINKAVPIVEVRPDGRTSFLAFSSSRGVPCVPGRGGC